MTHDSQFSDGTAAAKPALARWLSRRPIISISAVALAVMAMNGCTITPKPKSGLPTQGAKAGSKVDGVTFARIGEAARERGDLITAAAMYQRAYGLDPENPDIMVGLGNILMDASDYAGAVKMYQQALAKRPGMITAHMGLGRAQVSMDQPAKAVKHYQIAVNSKPSARAYNGLGVALDMAGDHKGAQKAYMAGIKLNNNYLPLKNNLGLSYTLDGKYKKAIKMLRETAANPTSGARERQNLALAYGLSGDREMAERISRVDLKETDVTQNVAYYDWLRQQPKAAVAVALRRGGAARDEKLRKEIAKARAEAAKYGGKEVAQLAMAGGKGVAGVKPKGVSDAPAVAACQGQGAGVNCLLAEAPPPGMAGPDAEVLFKSADTPGRSRKMGPH